MVRASVLKLLVSGPLYTFKKSIDDPPKSLLFMKG